MKKYSSYLCLCLIIAGCFEPAGRDNPLDAQSAIFSPRGRIQGYVRAYYQADRPIAGVYIYLNPSGDHAISAADGYFEFSGLPAGIYQLMAARTGYRSDSVEVASNNDIQTIQLQLNGIPLFKQVLLQTHHISRWWPSDDLYYISVMADIDDPDGMADIDSVWVEVPAGGNVIPLVRTGQNSNFSGTITDQELSVPSLYYLQGKPIMVFCRDLLGNVGESEQLYISRIIETIPELIYPTELASIGSVQITFSWEPLYLGFPFTYKLEIYQINLGVYNRIHAFPGLRSDTHEFTLDDTLNQGDYFWVLYIVDEFGDSSRSKEGAFRVN